MLFRSGIALEYHKYEIAKLLIASGADIITHNYMKRMDPKGIKVLIDAGVSVTDSDVKWIINAYGVTLIMNDSSGSYYTYLFTDFALIFKLFIKHNADLRMFWKYLHQSEVLMDKAFEYPEIAKYIKELGSNNINPPNNIKMINLFMNKIIENE